MNVTLIHPSWDGVPRDPDVAQDHLIGEIVDGEMVKRTWWWCGDLWFRVGDGGVSACIELDPDRMVRLGHSYFGPVVAVDDLEAWIAEADIMRNRAWAALSLLPDEMRLLDLREAFAVVQRLIAAAEAMPRETPAPGCAGTVHTFHIEAGVVWELDVALRRLRTIQKRDAAA